MMPALQAVASLTESKTIDICFSDQWKDGRRRAVEEICQKWGIVGKAFSYPSNDLRPQDYGLWFYSGHSAGSDAVIIFLRNMKYRPVPKPSWRNSKIYERDHYMMIAYAMGYKGETPQVQFPLADEPVLNSTKRPIIALCNGAFNTSEWQKKHWPHFPNLSKTLKRWFGGTIIGIGGKEEMNHVPLDIDFSGKLPMVGTAKVLSQCDLLITTDSGNMHLGMILDKPLIALFGPTLTSKNAPRNKETTILKSGIYCAPCQDTGRFYRCGDRNYSCMRSITVGDVMAVAKEKIK
jgi:ADP-heptose:LPS heptosyltransferase